MNDEATDSTSGLADGAPNEETPSSAIDAMAVQLCKDEMAGVSVAAVQAVLAALREKLERLP